MGNICEWLCPKRKQNQPYDVNEETFEIEQRMQEFDEPCKSPEDLKQTYIQTQTQEVLEQGAEKNRTQDKEMDYQQKIEQIKFTNQKNKTQGQKEGLQKQQQQSQRKFVDQKNKIEEQVTQKVTNNQQKPKPKYNILSTNVTKKKKVDPEQYRFANQSNQFKVKKIDTIKMEQFNFQNCRNGSYFIFDVTANVYIDETEDCFIFIAPCNSTIFVRNCKNLVLVAASGQFRTVNCENCYFSLLCKSGPVIQSSNGMNFSCFQCPHYQQLASQFQTAKLEIWNNYWAHIHDFTPKNEQQHYKYERHSDFQQVEWKKAFEEAEIQIIEQNQKVVPSTRGYLSLAQQNHQGIALLIFSKQISSDDSRIVTWITKNKLDLIKTSKMKVQGQGPQPIVSIIFAYNSQQQLDLEQVDNPSLITDKDDVKQKQLKYFLTFGDQR